MTERIAAVPGPRATPPGRVSGRYLVIGFVSFFAVFFAAMVVLAQRLEPAADRFHRGVVATPK